MHREHFTELYRQCDRTSHCGEPACLSMPLTSRRRHRAATGLIDGCEADEDKVCRGCSTGEVATDIVSFTAGSGWGLPHKRRSGFGSLGPSGDGVIPCKVQCAGSGTGRRELARMPCGSVETAGQRNHLASIPMRMCGRFSARYLIARGLWTASLTSADRLLRSSVMRWSRRRHPISFRPAAAASCPRHLVVLARPWSSPRVRCGLCIRPAERLRWLRPRPLMLAEGEVTSGSVARLTSAIRRMTQGVNSTVGALVAFPLLATAR